MSTTTSIPIDQSLFEQAKRAAAAEGRTVAEQIQFWARVGRAALDNPDLPANFVADALAALAEPRVDAIPFLPTGDRAVEVLKASSTRRLVRKLESAHTDGTLKPINANAKPSVEEIRVKKN